MIKNVIERLHGELPATVKLVAVSKFHPFEAIEEAYHAGQRTFGESRPQELLAKVRRLEDIRAERGEPDYMSDIEWHFIGHLQTNKIKYIAPFVTLIHALDSLSLLEAVNKEAAKNNRVIDCLLQFHIAQEETKFGLDIEEAKSLLESESFKNLKNINICGVMGMATFTDDVVQVRNEFKNLRNIFEALKENYFKANDSFKEISMGMSDDYPIAIEEGATMVRVGSKIFGARNYNV